MKIFVEPKLKRKHEWRSHDDICSKRKGILNCVDAVATIQIQHLKNHKIDKHDT